LNIRAALIVAVFFLAGCGSAAPAVVAMVRPSGFGVRIDPRYGRCYSAGAAIGGQVEVTAHICGRFLDGGLLPESDASAP